MGSKNILSESIFTTTYSKVFYSFIFIPNKLKNMK